MTKSQIPAVNALERVEVPQMNTESTHTPHMKKMGRHSIARNLILRRPQKQRTEQEKSLHKTIKGTQHDIEKILEVNNPDDGNPSKTLHPQFAGKLEHPSTIVVGNHKELEEINEENSTYYVDSKVI